MMSPVRQEGLKEIQRAVDNANRLNIEGALLVPGTLVPGMTMEQMTANLVKNLKYVTDKVKFGDSSSSWSLSTRAITPASS